MTETDFSWLEVSAEDAARRLLGCEIMSEINGQTVRVKIVEVEAYDQHDEASHTFRGQMARNSSMYKAAGHLYVYFTYGMHHCINIVCGKAGFGAGVLVRAVEPIVGLDIIEKRRGLTGKNVTNGPGKVAQALGITLAYNGHFLDEQPILLYMCPQVPAREIVVTKRIGISRAVHELRRFYIDGSDYISQK